MKITFPLTLYFLRQTCRWMNNMHTGIIKQARFTGGALYPCQTDASLSAFGIGGSGSFHEVT